MFEASPQPCVTQVTAAATAYSLLTEHFVLAASQGVRVGQWGGGGQMAENPGVGGRLGSGGRVWKPALLSDEVLDL